MQASTQTNENTNQEGSDNGPTVDELKTEYEKHDGNIAAVARAIEKSPSYTRQLLIDAEIHTSSNRLAYILENDLEADDVGPEAAL